MQTFTGALALKQFVAYNVTDDNSKQFNVIDWLLRYSVERPLFLTGFSYEGKFLVYEMVGMNQRKVTLFPIEHQVYAVRIETAKGSDLFRLTLANALRLFSDFAVVGIPTKPTQLQVMIDRYSGTNNAN